MSNPRRHREMSLVDGGNFETQDPDRRDGQIVNIWLYDGVLDVHVGRDHHIVTDRLLSPGIESGAGVRVGFPPEPRVSNSSTFGFEYSV